MKSHPLWWCGGFLLIIIPLQPKCFVLGWLLVGLWQKGLISTNFCSMYISLLWRFIQVFAKQVHKVSYWPQRALQHHALKLNKLHFLLSKYVGQNELGQGFQDFIPINMKKICAALWHSRQKEVATLNGIIFFFSISFSLHNFSHICMGPFGKKI